MILFDLRVWGSGSRIFQARGVTDVVYSLGFRVVLMRAWMGPWRHIYIYIYIWVVVKIMVPFGVI